MSQYAPRANTSGSSPNAATRSNTRLATHVPIGIVTRIGWTGWPYEPAKNVRGRLARAIRAASRSAAADDGVGAAVMAASLGPAGPDDDAAPLPYDGRGAAWVPRLGPAPGAGRPISARPGPGSVLGPDRDQRSAWNIQRCFSRSAVMPMSRSWLTTSVFSVSSIAARSRSITARSARTM